MLLIKDKDKDKTFRLLLSDGLYSKNALVKL